MFGSLRKKLNDAWSQADVWDKQENQQQRQVAQTRRQAQPTPPVQTRRNSLVGKSDNQPGFQITNNSFTRGLSRGFDQVNMFDDGRSWQNRTPTQKMSVGTQVRNVLDTNTEADQLKRQREGRERVLQNQGNVISNNFGALPRMANTAVNQAREVAEVGRGQVAMATNNQDALSASLERQDKIRQNYMKNKGGLFGAGTLYDAEEAKQGDLATGVKRIAGGTLEGMTDAASFGLTTIGGKQIAKEGFKQALKSQAPNIAKNAVANAVGGGASTFRQDGSMGDVAKSAAISGTLGTVADIGLASAGAVLSKPTTRLVQKTASAVSNIPSPGQVTTRLVNTGKKVDQALFTPRLNRLDLDTRDALIAYSDRLVGADPYITGKVESDLIKKVRAIGDANGVDLTNGTVVQQLDRIEALLNGYKGSSGALNSKPVPVDPLEALKQEARKYKKIYHGTDKVFDEFDVKKSADGGVWFTDRKDLIEKGEVGASGKGRVIERYIDENNLKLANWDDVDKYTDDQLINMGYDGYKLVDDVNKETTYKLFDPAKAQKTDLYNQALKESQPKGKNIRDNDPLESLKQEARKYKSADEFVKANYVAHGTPNKIEGNIRPSSGWYGKATYLTDDITEASGRGGGQNIYFVEKPKGKLLDIKAHGSKDNTSFTPKQYQDAIDNGYDGLRIKHDNGKTWYAMFKEQPAKTKQQLTDLYNQSKPSIKDKVKNSLKKLDSDQGGGYDGGRSATDRATSLKQEARKYKSAEEFVSKNRLAAEARITELQKQIDDGERSVDSLMRKTRKAPNAEEAIKFESQAQVIRKQLRPLKEEQFGLKDALDSRYGEDSIYIQTPAEREAFLKSTGHFKARELKTAVKKYTDLYDQAHSQPTPKAEAPDPLESLKQEARKYKSAEEFVKAKTNQYHGTLDKEFKLDPNSRLFLTGDTDSASTYAGRRYNQEPEGKVVGYHAKDGKTLDLNDNATREEYVRDVLGQNKQLKKYYDQIPESARNDYFDTLGWVMEEHKAGRIPKADLDKYTEAQKNYKGISSKDVYANWDKIIARAKKDGYDYIKHTTEDPSAEITFPETVALNPSKTILDKQQLTDLYNQATQPPKSTPDGRRVSNNFRPKDLGDKKVSKEAWFNEARKQVETGKADKDFMDYYNEMMNPEFKSLAETADKATGNGTLGDKVEVPTGFARSLEDAGIKPTSSGVQKVHSSSRIEPSASKSKTSVDQPQVAETPQSVKQGNAKGKVKQASQSEELGTDTSLSQGKNSQARSQKATATEKQSPETKLAKKEMQELSSTYPDNTTNVVEKRGFTQSVKRSGEVSPQTQKKVSGEYNVRSTKKLAISADEFSKGNINKVTKEVNSRLDVPTGKINDQDIADSIAVAKRLDAKGDHEQATLIYDKLAEHGTKGGQAIQAFSLLKNRTPDGLKFQAVKQLKKNGVKLTGDEEKQLGKLIDGVRKSKGEARDRAIYETFDFVSRKLPTSTGDKIVNFWRAGLLTAPRTTGGNILGNTTEAATRELWTNPVAVATDRFFSMFTGKRTKTLAGGRLKGAKEGIEKGIDYLKTGYDPRNVPNMKYDAPRRVNYKNKVVDTYVNGVYRWMGGQDQPFYYAAKSAAAYDLAKADGLNLKLKGKDLGEYIDKAISDENWKPQTFKTAKDATDYGKYAVYQNETVLGNMASGLKKSAGKARPVADFLMPFTQVPSSVAMRIVDRTPIGVAKEVVSQIKNKSFDQRAMSEAIANGSFGVPVLAAGYALAQSGMITGAYPQDSKERKLWDAEGKQPYSVKVGDRWYSLNYMQPFGTILSMGKQVADDKAEGKSDTESWMNAVATAAKSVENQSFLQGINGALSAVNDPQRSMKQYVNSTASGVIPNFVRSGATAADPYQREVKDAKEAFISGVPGARQSLNTKLDMFGNDLPARDNFLNQYFNPLRPSKVRDTDNITKELRRLQDADNGIVPTEFNKKSIGGVELNRDQIRKLNQQTNNAVQVVWGNVVQDPRYKQMEDGDKKRTLEKIKEVIAENSKLKFINDNGIKSTTDYKEKGLDLEKLLNGKSDKATKKTKSRGRGKSSGGGRRGRSKAGYDYTKALFDANVGSVSMTKDLQSILEKYMKANAKISKKA